MQMMMLVTLETESSGSKVFLGKLEFLEKRMQSDGFGVGNPEL